MLGGSVPHPDSISHGHFKECWVGGAPGLQALARPPPAASIPPVPAAPGTTGDDPSRP